jgi:porin
MKRIHRAAGGCLFALLSCMASTVTQTAVTANEWPRDVPFESCDGVYCDDVDCGDAGCADICCASAVSSSPVPGFDGCCCCRPKLTGDWGGCRTNMAAHGITGDFDVTQFYFAVTDGGLREGNAYGGRGDYVVNIDCGKLGYREGLFVKLRAEHRFGQDINSDTGAFFPTTIGTELPVADSDDVYLSNVLFTQMLSETCGVFFGKLDTFDGDQNAFASGRGTTQFSNIGFVINPIALRTIPYSTLGCGFVILQEGAPMFTYTLLNAKDTVRTSGFDELFEEGVAMSAELRLPVAVAGLPGHQLFGATWNSRDVVSLGQDPRVILPDVPIARQSGSWSCYWNCDQYLFVDPCQPGRGWGVFGRAGVADNETNPIDTFLSCGVGGTGMFRQRPADSFGVGWYLSKTSDEIGPLLPLALGPIGDGQAIELFYNIAVTPWFHVTPDLQVILPARENVETAVALGLRAKSDF